MNLISFIFAMFCILTILVYFVTPKKIRWIVLLISSLFFLFYKNFNVVTILQALTIFLSAYIFARLIEKYKDTHKSKIFLVISILLILLVLMYFKYSNLFLITIDHICNILKIDYDLKLVSRNSLIGLSYYSLIMIGYLTDVYRGSVKAEKNIFKCALFMAYFPILNSGPFIKFENMKDTLYEGHKFSYKRMCNGLIRIAWGAFKILVISQRCGYFVNTVWGDLAKFNGVYSIIAALLFPVELYANFSGSIDIIMGVSEIIGIGLPENFDSPFFSKTMTEFWRRWHITLGAWLRDYIFYPIQKSSIIQKLNKFCKSKFGKKVGKKIPLFISMFIMWLCIGIWHGGEYHYIIGSGILQFVIIFLEDTLTPISNKINDKLGINRETFGYKLYQVTRTFLLFSFTMIFFRATGVAEAIEFIKSMFVSNPWVLFDNESLYTAGLDMLDFRILNISLIVLFVIDYLKTKFDVREKLFSQNIVFRWTVIFVLLFSIIIFGCYGVGYNAADFIYRGF